jgi:hypothetical protein
MRGRDVHAAAERFEKAVAAYTKVTDQLLAASEKVQDLVQGGAIPDGRNAEILDQALFNLGLMPAAIHKVHDEVSAALRPAKEPARRAGGAP